MTREDAGQVSDIEREAFPTQWPPLNYHYELQNRAARFFVACDDSRSLGKSEVSDPPVKTATGLMPRLSRLFGGRRPPAIETRSLVRHYIVGFVGLWIMAGEAHITSIAVREAYRQRSIGELLLISAISLAMEMKATLVTLEVRVSNTSAQHLYTKYGFVQVGLRRGYYTDNKEDALIMSIQDVTSDAFRACFQELKQARSRNSGQSVN